MTPLEFRSARKKLRLTQQAAGRLGAISWSTVLRYEQGYLPLKLRAATDSGLRRAYDAMLNRIPSDPLADKSLTDWSRLDVKVPGPKKKDDDSPIFAGHDNTWLRVQTRTSLRELSVGRFESEALGALYIVSPEIVVEICRRVVTAMKRKHEMK